MRNSFATSGAFSLREHRLTHLETPGGLQGEIAKQIDEDLDYMDRQIDGVIQNRLTKKNVENLSPERRQGIDRQKQLIIDKLTAVKNFNYRYRNDYLAERNKLIDQVHQLVYYAEFQADQQKKLDSVNAEPLKIDTSMQGESHQYLIKADSKSVFEFAYIEKTPGAAMLVGTIKIEPNTVSSSMPGRFQVTRKDKEGSHYFVVTVDPRFDGTFTFISEGKRATVDVASQGEQRVMQDRLARRIDPTKPEEDTTVAEELKEILARFAVLNKEHETLLAQKVVALNARQGNENNQKIRDLESRMDAIDQEIAKLAERAGELNTIRAKAKQYHEQVKRRPYRAEEIAAPYERAIYEWLSKNRQGANGTVLPPNDRGFAIWFSGAYIPAVVSLPSEDRTMEYRVDEDGYLCRRKRDLNQPNRVASSSVYKDGKWVDVLKPM